MGRKRVIYFGLLLIVAVLVIVTSFSYAFLIKTEEHHGKLNMVVGTLDYKLSSKLLNNNSITLNSNEKAKLNIKIESLNGTDSKYELYYTSNNNGIEIGYTTLGDQPTGTIGSNKSKSVNVVIKNTSDSSATITFGIIGGFTGNTLVKETGTTLVAYNGTYCLYEDGHVFEFDYTGGEQEFDPPCSGNYKVELWGASGGYSTGTYSYGGYTNGNIDLLSIDKIYVYIGRQGLNNRNISFNGGGNGSSKTGYSGGGATDVRLVYGNWDSFDSLKSRIMVAAGGGGYESYQSGAKGGSAGGLSGYGGTKAILNGDPNTIVNSSGGTQTSGGERSVCTTNSYNNTSGSFGIGGNGPSTGWGSGAGGGYYGGGAGSDGAAITSSGAGGSSFISGYNGCDAISASSTENNIVHTGQSKHYSGKVFTDGVMIDGAGCDWSTGVATNCGANQPQPDGTMATGHTGNGYAKITYIGESNTEEITTINEADTEVPTLALSKTTYLVDDFSGWSLSNSTVSDGVLTLGANGNSATATSGYYDTGNSVYVITYDAYTVNPVNSNTTNGASYGGARYYNSSRQLVAGNTGDSSNGFAYSAPLNQWSPTTVDRGYGGTAYTVIYFGTGNTYSAAPVKIRNFKLWGSQIPNSFYIIKIDATDNVGVVTTKYASGSQTKEYVKNNGTIVIGNEIRVTSNGTYTVYVRDRDGNDIIQTIQITDIR